MMHELFMSPFFGIGLSIAAFWVEPGSAKRPDWCCAIPLCLQL